MFANPDGKSGRHGRFEGANADDQRELKGFRRYLKAGDLTEMKALAESTNAGADGGYAVPKLISSMIENVVVNISPIRQIANIVQIGTSDYHKLVNLRGTASGWVSETASRPATNTPQFADRVIKTFEIYAFPQASQQMLDDVFFDVESWLAQEIGTEFARAEGAAFVSGNGTTQPQGFLTGTPVSTADGAGRADGVLQYLPTGVSGAWPASNPADLLSTLVYSVKSAFRRKGTFVMSKSTLATISQFKDAGGRYILTPQTAPDMPTTIWGFPVVEAEDMPAIGANSLSVAFGDFSRGYEIVDRKGITILRDPLTNKPYLGVYATKRVGGAVVNSEALKLIKFSVS